MPDNKPLALVSGASSGIGRELARELAQHGHDLVLVGRRVEALDSLAGELRGHGATAHVMAIDLGEPGAASALAKRLADAGLLVSLLVNNAGLGDNGAFAASNMDKNRAQMTVNMVALTELTRLLLPSMLAAKRGHIVNIGSTASFLPGPFMAVYCATKAYVLSFSEALGEELRDSGVRVTAVCPGPTHSEFAQVAGNAARFEKAGKKVMSSAAVARQAWRAIERGEKVVVLGGGNKINAWLGRHLPHALLLPMARKALQPR